LLLINNITMLKRIFKYPAIIVLFLLLSVCARATNTYDWVGSTSTDWKTPQNWKLNGSTQSSAGTFPGQSASTDIVDFGVNTNYTANQPILSGTLANPIASMTFGGNGGAAMTLTVTGITLTVTGAITQIHGSGANTGTSISTAIQGTGSISCASMGIGNAATPGSQSNASQIFTTVLTSSIANLTVYGTLNINSQCLTHNGSHHDFYNPSFDLTGGALTVVNITVTASNYISGNAEAFNMGTSATANTLNIAGSITVTSSINGTVSFLNAAANTSASTVNYSGTGAQTVYTDADSFIASTPTTYGNLTFTNSGTKTLDGSTLTVGGNLVNNSGSVLNGNATSGSSTISGTTNNAGTLNINAETTAFMGLVSNTGTYTGGTGASTFSSSFSNNGGAFTAGTGSTTFNGNYTNTGTFTANSTGSVIFGSSGAQSLVDNSGAGTTLINTQFQGGGTKTMSGSKAFYISSAGTLTMSGNTTLAAGGVLTLNSDASGSARIASVPSGCSITGAVAVQQYISGTRGWRFLSAPVYAGTDSYSNKISSIKYLQNSIYISGSAGTSGGFDWAGNPSLFLYREDNTPANNTFINTNFRAIASLLSDPAYPVSLENGSYSIPVANGYQVFIRGDRATGTATQEKSSAWTFSSVILTASGTLNQGQISFKSWYTPGSSFLSYQNPDPTLLGYNLVGNPYPSAINWDTYNTTDPNTGIYANKVGLWIYSYNMAKKKYAVYQAGSEGKGGTNGATNVVGSGQGFFVVANGTDAKLIFNESGKTSSSSTGVGAIMSSQPTIASVIQFIRLRMTLDSLNTDETVLRFNSNAKNTFDIDEDAPYMPGGGKLSLNSLSQDSVSLAINQLPLKNGQHTGLKIDASASGTYSLDLEELNGVPQIYNIWLKDAFAGDSVNLRKTNTYSFTIDKSNAASFGSHRFSIIVKQDSAYVYKLLSFNAARVGNSSHVETHWTTANEENYTNFTVERSTDGGNTFTVVGGLWGTGAGAYSLVDKDAVTGTNLYRLKSEDINNTANYSNIATVVIRENGNNNADKIHLYPNPTSGIVNVNVLDKTNGNISYKITVSNNTGFIVKQVTSSKPNWQADVSALLPGTYLIRVINSKTQDFIGESKLIKL